MSCESPVDGTGFWVGKKSFQQWRRHAKVTPAITSTSSSDTATSCPPGSSGGPDYSRVKQWQLTNKET